MRAASTRLISSCQVDHLVTPGRSRQEVLSADLLKVRELGVGVGDDQSASDDLRAHGTRLGHARQPARGNAPAACSKALTDHEPSVSGHGRGPRNDADRIITGRMELPTASLGEHEPNAPVSMFIRSPRWRKSAPVRMLRQNMNTTALTVHLKMDLHIPTAP